jgi:hypothetical protein
MRLRHCKKGIKFQEVIMKFPRLRCIISVILLFATISFAQDVSPSESQSEKEKIQKDLEERVLKIIDQAVGDANYLKLPQNRATIYAIAGDLYWKFDEKRARDLFRNAANEIVIGNTEKESEKKETDDPYAAVFEYSGNDARNEVLPLVAKHDADLALELLAQTRPAKLTAAMAKALQPNAKQESGFMSFDPDRYRVQAEVALEQRFAVLAAEQNPERAVKMIKDSLAKGISWNVLPLLQKLNKQNEKKAMQVADDVVSKINDTDLSKKKDDLNAAIGFLQYATNPNASKSKKEKQFRFSDPQLKSIAVKLADTFLQPTNSLDLTMGLTKAMASLEKFVPEKLAALKQKQFEAMKNLPPELKRFEQQQKLWNPNSTPEEILAELPKITNEFEKVSAFESLSYKISEIDDDARAKKLIEQIPDDKARENAKEKYESAKISRAAKDGKLDEAKSLIGNLSKKKTQIQQLVSLAVDFYKKGTKEDIETAEGLMKDAKGLTTEFPEDEDDLANLMELVRGYAKIKPDEGFRLFEPVVDQINDYVQALAILSKYNKRDQRFNKGELIMKVNGSSWDGMLLFKYDDQIKLLGKADLVRMNLLTDKFQRPDARSIAKLYVAQGFLAEEKKDSEDDQSGGESYYFEF